MISSDEIQQVEDIYLIAGHQLESLSIKEIDNPSIWEMAAQATNILLKKPQLRKSDNYEISQQISKRNGISYIIKNTANNAYISLNEEEFFVWELLDGTKTIADICHIYFLKYKKISKMPVKLIDHLEVKNMLRSKSWNIYVATENAKVSHLRIIIGKISAFFMNSKFTLKNTDKIMQYMYDKFAWIFLKKEMLYIYFILCTAGLAIFITGGYFAQQFALTKYINYKFSISLLLFFAIFPVVLHELAHAFTCKRFGRHVNRAGVMLYIGIPVLFVDTTDIWMRPKIERILVSVAGPFTDLLFGSLCFLFHSLIGNYGIFQLLPLIGLIAYLRCLFNFNPLLEFDGYYILMDVLEIPDLRKKSFAFLRTKAVGKLLKPKELKRDEIILLLYGVIAAIYTYWMIFFMLRMWHSQLRAVIFEVWKNKHLSIGSQALIIFVMISASIRLMFVGRVFYLKIKSLINKLAKRAGGKYDK